MADHLTREPAQAPGAAVSPEPVPAAPAAPPQTANLRNYILVTAAYWGFTLTDGAIRMLVLLHFHTLGYSPFEVAMLFLFYEFFGVVTNLVGGWIGQRLGLKITLYSGLGLQVVALGMLGVVPSAWLLIPAFSVPFVMAAQALSGIAKDLTKMSSKSAIKLVVPENADSTLFKWVSILTGSKNALKGVGFFIGGVLLTVVGFQMATLIMAVGVLVVLLAVLLLLRGTFKTPTSKVAFKQIFSKSRAINMLSAARLFLFGSRDVWFVVGLPVFLYEVLGWTFWQVGGFLAVWIIGYGIVQAATPTLITRRLKQQIAEHGQAQGPDGTTATLLAFALAAFPAGIALALMAGIDPTGVLVGGLIAFGIMFALNSAVHSYLILAYTQSDQVALNVGFYYMANAGGRLVGTVLSGALYLYFGLVGCLWASVVFVLAAGLLSLLLPRNIGPVTQPLDLKKAME
jgi:MFS family permease